MEKKLFLILVVLFLISWCPNAVHYGETTCSTPSNGANATEGFEGTGYENSGSITEQYGNPNEDYSNPGTPPTGGCLQGMYLDVNEAALGIVYDHGSALDTGSTTVTVEFYIYFVTSPGASDQFTIYSFGTSSTAYTTGAVARILLLESGGNVQVQAIGATTSTAITIATPAAWNKITLVMHTTAASSSISVNDAGTQTFTRSVNAATQYHHIGAPGASTGDTAQFVMDLFSY